MSSIGKAGAGRACARGPVLRVVSDITSNRLRV